MSSSVRLIKDGLDLAGDERPLGWLSSGLFGYV